MNLIKYGEKFFDEMEIEIYRKREISAVVELNQLSSTMSRDLKGAVIRGIKDKRVGTYIIDSANEEDIKEGIEKAYKIALQNEKDENWNSLPEKQVYDRSRAAEEMENLKEDYLVNSLVSSLKKVKEKKPEAIVVGAETGALWEEIEVYNSHGIEVAQNNSGTYFLMALSEKIGDSVTPTIFDMDARRDLNLKYDEVIDSTIAKVKNAEKVVKAENGEFDILLEPFALGEILQFAMYPSFSGERKVKGTSVLSDKIGEKVVSEKITIEDNPFHKLSLNSLIADDEGVAIRRNVVIENGIFKSFLWNTYWGNLAGVKSTGNGLRSFRTGAVGIGFHNMVISPGKESISDIIGEMKKGYVVSSFQGAHSSNPDTGDIAAVANPAFFVEDGEIKGSTVFMVSGNIYEIMENVVKISSEQKPIYAMAKGVYPALLVENVKIASVST